MRWGLVNAKIVLQLAVSSIVIGALVGLLVLVQKSGLMRSIEDVRAHAHFSPNPSAKSHRMPFAPAFLCAFFILKIFEMYRWEFL